MDETDMVYWESRQKAEGRFAVRTRFRTGPINPVYTQLPLDGVR
jgi:hypothetical protein